MVPHATHFLVYLTIFFTKCQKSESKCCSRFSVPIFGPCLFLFVYWEWNKTAKQFGYAGKRAEGRMEACNPLIWNITPSAFPVLERGSYPIPPLFLAILISIHLTKPFCPIWLGLFASDTFSAYRLMVYQWIRETVQTQSLSVLSFCLSAARPWFFCSDSIRTHANVTKN